MLGLKLNHVSKSGHRCPRSMTVKMGMRLCITYERSIAMTQGITVTSKWARWRLKSPASRLFTQSFTGVNQRKHQSSASLAFVRGIHRWPVNSPHKGPVTQKMFAFDDVIMDHVDFTVCACCWENGDAPTTSEWSRSLLSSPSAMTIDSRFSG